MEYGLSSAAIDPPSVSNSQMVEIAPAIHATYSGNGGWNAANWRVAECHQRLARIEERHIYRSCSGWWSNGPDYVVVDGPMSGGRPR